MSNKDPHIEMSNAGIEGTRKFSLSGWFSKWDLEAVALSVSEGRWIYLAKGSMFSILKTGVHQAPNPLFSNQIKSGNLNA